MTGLPKLLEYVAKFVGKSMKMNMEMPIIHVIGKTLQSLSI